MTVCLLLQGGLRDSVAPAQSHSPSSGIHHLSLNVPPTDSFSFIQIFPLRSAFGHVLILLFLWTNWHGCFWLPHGYYPIIGSLFAFATHHERVHLPTHCRIQRSAFVTAERDMRQSIGVAIKVATRHLAPFTLARSKIRKKLHGHTTNNLRVRKKNELQ